MGPRLHACRTVGFWPNTIHELKIWQYLRKEWSRGVRTGSKVSAPIPDGPERNLVWNISTLCTATEYAHYYSPLLTVASSSSLLPPSLCFHSFFLFLFIYTPISLSLPFPSSALPSAFLSARGWNRKSWFNISQSEFCIHVTAGAARVLLVRRAKWNHIMHWDTFMNSNATFGLVQIQMSVWWVWCPYTAFLFE